MHYWTGGIPPETPAPAAPAKPKHETCGKVMRRATGEDCTPKDRPPFELTGARWLYCDHCGVLVAARDC